MGRSKVEQEAIDAVRASRPTKRLIAWKSRNCPECAKEFIVYEGPGQHQIFCCTEHRDHFRSRNAARGKVILPYLLAWRGGRGKSGTVAADAYAEFIRMLDSFNDEDRKAGRPKLDDYVANAIASGFSYIDRRR